MPRCQRSGVPSCLDRPVLSFPDFELPFGCDGAGTSAGDPMTQRRTARQAASADRLDLIDHVEIDARPQVVRIDFADAIRKRRPPVRRRER